MTRRSKLWRIGAPAWVFINGAGAIYAARMGEMMHASTHLVLLVVSVGAYAVWRMNPQAAERETR
jgi:hypothetical protein